jgi:hypothetical protein
MVVKGAAHGFARRPKRSGGSLTDWRRACRMSPMHHSRRRDHGLDHVRSPAAVLTVAYN